MERASVPSPGHPAAWLARAAATYADAVALSWDAGGLAFGDLARRVRVVSARLQRAMAGARTLVLHPATRLETALGLYAGLHLDRRLLPLSPQLPRAEQRRLCARAGDAALLGPDPDLARDLGCIPVPSALLHTVSAIPQALPSGSGADACLLIATSGSSGAPALVLLPAPSLAAGVAAARARIPLGPGDCWLACLSLHHVGGVAILLRALEAAARLHLHEVFDAARVWRELGPEGVTHLSVVPAMLHRLLETAAGAAPPPTLRAVLVGGAALDPGLAGRALDAGWPLCVSYGLSEAGSQVSTCCGPGAGRDPGRVGRPLEGFEVAVADADATGVGRIRLRGPALMAGYGEPGVGLSGGWLETGDLGRVDAEGELTVLGRADDVLVSGGEQVHPVLVEPVLRACPGVREAALSGLPDPVWGQRLVAVYTGDASNEALRTHCRDRLPAARRPRAYLRVQALPLGRTGKLDRRALRQLVLEHPGL